MLNLKHFEEEIYALVTQRVNQAFTELLKGEGASVQSRGIQLYRAVLKVLHGVAEETAVQILCGLVTDVQARVKKKD